MLVGEDKTISFVDAPGATLALSVEGGTQEKDPAAVLLRGGPGVLDHRTDVAESLARGHRGIRCDQRGTGRSINHDGRFGLVRKRRYLGGDQRTFLRPPHPNARHVVLENAGLIAWLQGPGAFRAELCAFFVC